MTKGSHKKFLLIITLLICISLLILSEKIPKNNGLGYDGATYAFIIKNYSDIIIDKTLTTYRIQRILPLSIILFIFKTFQLELTDTNIIFAFGILNLIAILLSIIVWFKIADILRIDTLGIHIGYITIFVNYFIPKQPY